MIHYSIESQVEELRKVQLQIKDIQYKIHNIQTKFYPMVAYFICAFANAVDASPLYHMWKHSDQRLSRGEIEQIADLLYAYLESEEMRNKVGHIETFDIEQFVEEFRELCDCKAAEAEYKEKLADLQAQERRIKTHLGIT